jgi:ABC-type uncharacterized transport system substrate-binding protein
LSNQSADVAGKQVELLREVVPTLSRLAILFDVDNPVTVLDVNAIQTAAGTLGIKVTTLEIRRADDIAPAFTGLRGRADAPSSRPTLSS